MVHRQARRVSPQRSSVLDVAVPEGVSWLVRKSHRNSLGEVGHQIVRPSPQLTVHPSPPAPQPSSPVHRNREAAAASNVGHRDPLLLEELHQLGLQHEVDSSPAPVHHTSSDLFLLLEQQSVS
eukprot:763615-Hanusia_phi.AAC.4